MNTEVMLVSLVLKEMISIIMTLKKESDRVVHIDSLRKTKALFSIEKALKALGPHTQK